MLDIQPNDQGSIEGLYKKKLLQKTRVLTYADFTQTAEADVEDMFERSFYLSLVNADLEDVVGQPNRAHRFRGDRSRSEVIQKQLARLPTRREPAETELGIISATMMLTTLSLLFFLR